MKKISLLLVLTICTVSAFSQYYEEDEQVFKFGLGTALSLPVGDLKDGSTYGIGFQATGVYNFSYRVAAFLQTGVDVFSVKDAAYYGSSSGMLHVPILAGPRLKFGGFFAGAGVGYGLWSYDGSSANGFMYSPQIGYDFGHYQLMLNYSSTSAEGGSLSYFGLKAFRTF